MKSNAFVRGHLGKWPPSRIIDRMDLIIIEMSPANFGACITIFTIHPKHARYVLHCNSVTTCPNDGSLTKFVIVEKYGTRTFSYSDLCTRFDIFT